MKPRALLCATVMLIAPAVAAAPVSVKAPLVCSRGPSDSAFTAVVTMPFSQPVGSTFTVRIDATPSGVISHTGLNYIHDMQTDYLVPVGTSYVEGSAHIVADTGTTNVRGTARVWHDAGTIHFLLPARVENGSSYTPPSIEFDVKVAPSAGPVLSLKLVRYQAKVNAIIVGELLATCEPNPKPYTVGVTMVETPAPR